MKTMKTLVRTSALALLGALLLAPVGAGRSRPTRTSSTYPKFTYQPPSAKEYRTVLKSGPVAYVAEDRELPLVSINVTLRGGTYLDPAGKEGLAELAGYLLARGGTKSKTAEQLEERLAFLAAQLNSGYDDDRGFVSLNLLAKDLDEGLAILREVLTEPRFQDDKLKLRKDQLLTDMKSRNDDTADIEQRERGFLAFGEGYYQNRYTTKASLEGITRDDLVAFHRKWVDPKNVVVAVAGDFGKGVTRAQMIEKLDALFAKWPYKGEAAPSVPKPDPRDGARPLPRRQGRQPGARLRHAPGRSCGTTPTTSPPLVMNDILGGGGFTSRITNRVRSDEGLAYSAGSGLRRRRLVPGDVPRRLPVEGADVRLRDRDRPRGDEEDPRGRRDRRGAPDREELVRRHPLPPFLDEGPDDGRLRRRGVHRPLRAGPGLLPQLRRRGSRR